MFLSYLLTHKWIPYEQLDRICSEFGWVLLWVTNKYLRCIFCRTTFNAWRCLYTNRFENLGWLIQLFSIFFEPTNDTAPSPETYLLWHELLRWLKSFHFLLPSFSSKNKLKIIWRLHFDKFSWYKKNFRTYTAQCCFAINFNKIQVFLRIAQTFHNAILFKFL